MHIATNRCQRTSVGTATCSARARIAYIGRFDIKRKKMKLLTREWIKIVTLGKFLQCFLKRKKNVWQELFDSFEILVLKWLLKRATNTLIRFLIKLKTHSVTQTFKSKPEIFSRMLQLLTNTIHFYRQSKFWNPTSASFSNKMTNTFLRIQFESE